MLLYIHSLKQQTERANTMTTVKLTKDAYLKSGQLILADPRCDDEVKLAVRRGTSGEIDSNGMLSYITDNNTWYDQIITGAAA